jgi:small neutral amino acid transporter SnatA (MarC family)
MAASLLVGAFMLQIYGISVPVLRIAGGVIVAISGWKLLNEGTSRLFRLHAGLAISARELTRDDRYCGGHLYVL